MAYKPWNTERRDVNNTVLNTYTSGNNQTHSLTKEGRKNDLFNDALNIFYLRLYGVIHMVKDHSDSEREETRCHIEGRILYGKTRKDSHCCHNIGYSFRLAARVLLYASSHRQDKIYT